MIGLLRYFFLSGQGEDNGEWVMEQVYTKEKTMAGQFFVLFAMMGVGYYCSRKKYLNDEMTVGVGNLVLFITIPVLLFLSLANTKIQRNMLINFGTMVALQFVGMIIYGRVLRCYYKWRKFPEEHLTMLEMTAVSVNNAFIGFPVAALFFGEEGVVYMTASVLGLNLYLWTVGLYVIKGVKGESLGSMVGTLVRGAINPNVSAILLGLLAAILGVMAYVPEFIVTFLNNLGGVSTPLSLIYIGALTGNKGIRALLREKKILEASAIKVTALPVMSFVLIYFLPIDPLVKAVYFIATALPAAAIVPMIIGRYGAGVEISSKMVLVTTVLSMGVIPICIAISRIWI